MVGTSESTRILIALPKGLSAEQGKQALFDCAAHCRREADLDGEIARLLALEDAVLEAKEIKP